MLFEILRKEIFRGRPRNSLMGPFIEKYGEYDSEQHLLNNAFQNVCRFRDIRGQRFNVLAPKIPYYVTFDLNSCINRFRLLRATFLFL